MKLHLENKLNIIIIFAVSLLLIVFLVLLLSDTPAKTLFFFFIGPFLSLFSLGNMLNYVTPLILGGLAVTIAMKAGNLNLGGEGQVYFGAFLTTIIALALSPLGAIGAVIAVIAGSLCVGILCAFCGFCKAKWNTNELITTFLLSCAIIPIINYLITGPFMDSQTSLLSTAKITESMRLPLLLKQSKLNAGFLIALVFVPVIHLFLNKSKMGYEFRITGMNELFARYGGINTKLNTVVSMAMSGTLYGLAGSIAVLGTYHAAIKEFSAGLGWSGLTVALIAGFSPVSVIPCAIFLAWINSGARAAMQNTGLTYEIAIIVEAVIFMLSASSLIKNISFNKRKG
ncbi:MAG: ABC transporter permease [Treponema sp.]|nr:ABC transporter permease [Treponema sp.]